MVELYTKDPVPQVYRVWRLRSAAIEDSQESGVYTFFVGDR